MPLVVGYDQAKKIPMHRVNQAGYFEFKDQPDMPHALLNGRAGTYYSEEHYHELDQFQVVMEGSFRMGRHEVSPYCIHFSRAYTPYGPLVSKPDAPGLAFMVMRAHRDYGAMRLSKMRQDLERVPNRAPWQVSQMVTFPTAESRSDQDACTEPVPNIKDDHGLAAYTIILKPYVSALAPAPSPRGDGQYILLVQGSLLHGGTEHNATGLVFVRPEEKAFELHAGPEGLVAIVLNFPEPTQNWARANTERKRQPALSSGFKRWRCVLCEFSYDEAKGMPEEDIAPGTRWQDVPESWTCPDCSASKGDFEMVEVV